MRRWFALIAAFLIAGCTTASPSTAFAANSDDSPPLIAGRVALAEGDSQIWRTEEDNAGQWDMAAPNDVVSIGTGLYTGADGRNEVRVGPHTFRLGANSRGGFSQLDYANTVFNLEYGVLNMRLARPEPGEQTAVTVSGVTVDVTSPGRYRIDATDNGPVRVTVFEGHGTVRSPAGAVGVSPGQAIVVNAGGAGVTYEQAMITDFDQWALRRDDRYREVRAAQYVSPYMTGYEELDTYGDWSPDPTYGTVWYPRVVPVGWAPYRYGQWRWVRPWGWTWVDQAPWGYAPFHYGRWVMAGGRWCWVPGGYVRRPVWAPALVGFVGSNVGVSVGVGPVVGWYPLAPWHRYEPHYRHDTTYVTVINQTIINNPPRGVPHTINQGPGATMVPGPRFREPINKVVLAAQPQPRVEDLRPVAPPPRNVAPAPRPSTPKFAEQDQRGRPDTRGETPVQPRQPAPPPQAGSPPTRVTPPIVAQPLPGRGVNQQPPLPGNDPAPLAQPPLKRGQPVAPQPAPPPQVSPPKGERPPPRPNLPSDQIPPGQPKPINPAEPLRFPPGAPPTVRQPQPQAASPARPVQPSPAVVPAPVAQPQPGRPVSPAAVPGAAAPGAPPAVAHPAPHQGPTPKEQAQRNAGEQSRGRPVESDPQKGKDK